MTVTTATFLRGPTAAFKTSVRDKKVSSDWFFQQTGYTFLELDLILMRRGKDAGKCWHSAKSTDLNNRERQKDGKLVVFSAWRLACWKRMVGCTV